MAFIFLRVPIIFTISSSEFHQVQCRKFISNDEWPPVHPSLVYWIIMFRGNAAVLSQAAIETKNSSRVKRCTSVDLVCLTGKSQLPCILWKSTASGCHHVWRMLSLLSCHP